MTVLPMCPPGAMQVPDTSGGVDDDGRKHPLVSCCFGLDLRGRGAASCAPSDQQLALSAGALVCSDVGFMGWDSVSGVALCLGASPRPE